MQDIYTALVSKFLFPLHEMLKSHESVAIRKQLEISQWWSPEKLEQYRSERLRRFLCQVRSTVPYYQNLMAELKFDPEKVTSSHALQRLPFLNKTLIRGNIEKLKADTASKLARFNTGGSSGEPLIFYIGNERIGHDVAAKWRATRWWNVDIGDREFVIWGSPIELGKQDKIKMLRDKFFRTELHSAFEITDEKMELFVQKIKQKKPKMLFGYPSTISYIGNYILKNGIDLSKVGIKVVFVTSERLYEEQRTLIRSAFHCPVANGYGGRDAGFIAHQCPAGGMHITAEDIIVEIIDAEGKVVENGQSGEIVITHMATSEFPFIRYRTGDVGILSNSRCSCGRGLPLLEEIQGRSTDFVVAKDGKIMHGLSLIYILRDLPEINLFKIVQQSIDLTEVFIVAHPTISSERIQFIQQEFRKRLGAEVSVEIHLVKHIENEKSGKFRYVISKVSEG